MKVTTLARLPFRLGLGRVMDAIVIFRPLRPICILVRTRILFCFIYDLDLCMYLFGSWLVESSRLYYILLWVPSWACVLLLTWFHPHNVYVVCAHFAWWCVSKATSCELWRVCCNSQGADFGASQVVSEPRFCRYPWIRSACRITLPMVVVESSVKTILLKMCWIALSRSAFYSLPMCFSPLTFASFEASLLPVSLSSRFPRGGTISCLQPNRSALWRFIIVNASKKPLVGGVDKFNTMKIR
jgi:hypothetical protein